MVFSGRNANAAMKVTDEQAMQEMMALLEDWQAPEVSPWFESRMAARFREEQMRPPVGFFARMRDYVLFSSQASMRPLMAGALAVLLIAGGGGVWELQQARLAAAQGVSATVEDLQILDTNAQTIQQMSQLLDDDEAPQS